MWLCLCFCSQGQLPECGFCTSCAVVALVWLCLCFISLFCVFQFTVLFVSVYCSVCVSVYCSVCFSVHCSVHVSVHCSVCVSLLFHVCFSSLFCGFQFTVLCMFQFTCFSSLFCVCFSLQVLWPGHGYFTTASWRASTCLTARLCPPCPPPTLSSPSGATGMNLCCIWVGPHLTQ